MNTFQFTLGEGNVVLMHQDHGWLSSELGCDAINCLVQ